jgi:hypothetical protein
MFLIGAAYSICIMASMLYGWAFLGHAVIVRDFYEIPKAMFPVVFFTLGREIELLNPRFVPFSAGSRWRYFLSVFTPWRSGQI